MPFFSSTDYVICSKYVYKDNKGKIESKLISMPNIPDELEYRKIESKNQNVEVEFRNILGGRSYWEFEQTKTSHKAEALKTDYKQTNHGARYSEEIELYSKVPDEFFDYVRGIITSNYVYATRTKKYLLLQNNEIVKDTRNKCTHMYLKFKVKTSYNPSLIW